MTTASTNEMLASENVALAADLENAQTELDVAELRIKELESRLATTPSARDVREALDELLRCANAIVGADPSDSEAAEAFTMFDLARVKARKCLALDAAAPAAGGDAEPVAWVVRLKYGVDHWSGEMLTDVLPSDTETYRIIRPLYAAPPLQAASHSDAVREAAQDLIDRWETPQWKDAPATAVFINRLRTALTAPAAKAPAVSEADVGRLNFLTENTNCELSCSGGWDDDPMVWNVHRVNGGRNDREWTLIGKGATPRVAIDAAIQSAAQGGGTELESQAKATEGKAGMAVGTPHVRQTTAGTGLRVGEAGAVQPATSEFMDVTAGETAPFPSDPPSQEASAPEPVAWIDFADNGNVRLWTHEKSRMAAETAEGRMMTPVYVHPPAGDRP